MEMALPVIGWFVSPTISTLLNYVIKHRDDQKDKKKKMEEEVEEEFDSLIKKLRCIHGSVEHAEDIQFKNKGVREWLAVLKDLMYDAEDLVDLTITNMAIAESDASPSSSVEESVNKCGSFAVFTKRISRKMKELCIGDNKGTEDTSNTKKTALLEIKWDGVSVAHHMKKINKRLEEILDLGHRLGLINLAVSNSPQQLRSSVVVKNRESTSILDRDFPIIGRDDIVRKIIDMMLPQSSSSSDGDAANDVERGLSVLPIIGMGGVGKTTLVRNLYNNEKVDSSFKLKIWVCVGMYKELDVKQITSNIINSINGIDSHRAAIPHDHSTLDSLQRSLIKQIREKQPFLLVLDDAWDAAHHAWDDLMRPLKAFGKNNWIIVTTRERNVADALSRNIVTTRGPETLDCMSEEDTWKIFKMHAFGYADGYVEPGLEQVGREIVRRLKGLPLAAQTIGSILKRNRDLKEWNRISNSELLRAPDDRHIMSILLLSYYNLPTHLKRCFSYLSLFPKDYEICRANGFVWFGNDDDIIMQWMANGFLHDEMETKSFEGFSFPDAFVELIERSLLKIHDKNWIKMHDLIHDMADVISEEECYRISDDATKKPIPKKVRHISFFYPNNMSLGSTLSKIAYHKRLRTLLIKNFKEKISRDLVDNWFKSFTCLRVLYLKDNNLTSLPESIGKLKLLRYLYLDLQNIKELPESVSQLYNLQVLMVHDCWKLCAMPKNMKRLVNLKYMCLHDTIELSSGIGALTKLQKLSHFNVKEKEGYMISELKKLNRLSGSLLINGMENIKDKESAQEAQLHKKEKLDKLIFHWDSFEHGIEQQELDILEGLHPSNNLKSLEISNYKGAHLPEWLENQHLPSLEAIDLSGCKCLKSFPSLTIALRKLIIKDSPKLLGIISFPSTLQILVLENVGVKVLSFLPSQLVSSTACDPPLLRDIQVTNCPNLDDSLNTVLKKMSSSLQNLHIDGYAHPLDDLSHLTAMQKLELNECSGNVIFRDPSTLSSLESLCIKNCASSLIPQEMPIWSFPVLKKLEIQKCNMEQLERLLLGVANSPLTDLVVSDLDGSICLNGDLRSLFLQLTNIQSLDIRRCSVEQLCGLLVGVGTSPLRDLTISDCDLTSFDGDLESNFLQLTTLVSLTIRKCRYLLSLPTDLRGFKYLRYLFIYGCPNVALIPRDKFPDSLRIGNDLEG